jgi:hypothetical protein
MTDRDKLDTRVLRRIDDNILEQFMSDLLNEDAYNPCFSEDADEYVASMCDLLKDDFIDYIDMSDTSLKTKDALFYYIIDKFDRLLLRIYRGRRC